MKKQIPPVITELLQRSATAYSESEATTNAGLIIRFIARVIPVSFVLQLFAHKMKKPLI